MTASQNKTVLVGGPLDGNVILVDANSSSVEIDPKDSKVFMDEYTFRVLNGIDEDDGSQLVIFMHKSITFHDALMKLIEKYGAR